MVVHWLCYISCQVTDAHLGSANRREWTGECSPYAALLPVALMRTPQSTLLCSVANSAVYCHAGLMNLSERFDVCLFSQHGLMLRIHIIVR